MSKVVVVTGASQGLGAAGVAAYHRWGWAVVANSATRGIRFNAVSPGIIKTPMHAPENHEFLAAQHPVKRFGEATDNADAIVHLENASFVTGEILRVDGGQSAGR